MKKNIIITGSSGILGKYLVNQFKKGNNIISISKNKETKTGIMNFNCNLSNDIEVDSAFDLIKKKFKKIDLIILCAGKSKKNYKKIENLTSWKSSFENNFFSTTNVLESYLKIYKYAKTKIIVISSIAGSKILEGAPITYSVAKNALNFYVKFKSKELAKYKICINTISPGNILMKGNNWYLNKKKNKRKVMNYIKKNVPLNNFCKPENIFLLCEFLMDDKNDSTTGSDFIIDSGQSL
jgi:NAD(P)-dependent dehydrogenase (short-subunit alcohol dehydrogenase family)